MRLCSSCRVEKPIDEFYKNGKFRRGCCKACDNLRRRNGAPARPRCPVDAVRRPDGSIELVRKGAA